MRWWGWLCAGACCACRATSQGLGSHAAPIHCPLMSQAVAGVDASFAIKRQWDDDVVFRNQTRGEPKGQKRFINDTIRNDFHKRFLEKYVR